MWSPRAGPGGHSAALLRHELLRLPSRGKFKFENSPAGLGVPT